MGGSVGLAADGRARIVHASVGVRYLDTAILDRTEWLCRRFQLATGKTNVWVAIQLTNLSIVVYFVWAALYFWEAPVVWRAVVALFCAALLYVLSQTVLKVPIEAYEKGAFHRVAQGLRNPRRLRDAQLRTSFLTLSFVLWYPIVFVYLNSPSAGSPADLLAHRVDDPPPLRAGVRSPPAACGKGKRMASSAGSDSGRACPVGETPSRREPVLTHRARGCRGLGAGTEIARSAGEVPQRHLITALA